MKDILLTVKITSPDGSWQAALELVKQIVDQSPCNNLNIEVGDVWCGTKTPAAVQTINSHNTHSVIVSKAGE